MASTFIENLLLRLGDHFVISGNVSDLHYLPNGKPASLQAILSYLIREKHPETVIVKGSFLDGMNGLSSSEFEAHIQKLRNQMGHPGDEEDSKEVRIAKVIRAMVQYGDKPTAILLDLSALPTCSDSDTALEHLKVAVQSRMSAQSNSSLIFIGENIPSVLSIPELPVVFAPLPDLNARRRYIESEFETISSEEVEIVVRKTEGRKLVDLLNLKRFRSRNDHKSIEKLIEMYDKGVVENRWDQLCARLPDLERLLRERIKGQEAAIQLAVRVIRKAALQTCNITDSVKKPQCLFLAGPTGTGKTALVRALTKLCFGCEERMIRFNASEFLESHSLERLTGAPPGYTGHEQGGELTNAVKEKPFSVIFFDEIDKATHLLLIKLMQILDTGFCTDGLGQKVDFSNTIFAFSSNLGFENGSLTADNCSVDEIKEVVADSLQRSLRSEILGRIGKNIAIFDFIREPVAKEILDQMLENCQQRLQEILHVEVEVTKAARHLMLSKVDLRYGGRGIAEVVNAYVTDPTEKAFVDYGMPKNGLRIVVDTVDGDIDIYVETDPNGIRLCG